MNIKIILFMLIAASSVRGEDSTTNNIHTKLSSTVNGTHVIPTSTATLQNATIERATPNLNPGSNPQKNKTAVYAPKHKISLAGISAVIKNFVLKLPLKNFTTAFMDKMGDFSKEVKHYLKGTTFGELKEDARSFVSLTVPQAGFFSDIVGLGSGNLTNLSYFFFIGWPLLLILMYITLIVLYPNRRSDNVFEKNLSTMVDSMSYVMHMAEDSFLDFMEDITEPEDSYSSGSFFRPAYAFPDPENRKEVYYKPTAYYDEDGDHVDLAYDFYDEGRPVDDWGNPLEESSSFVNPAGGFHNPVVSFNPVESSIPLREEVTNDDISAFGQDFSLQNELAEKDKQNFLNVLLGTQYQHTRPQGSLTEQGVVQGVVGSSLGEHPEPPRRHRPSHENAPPLPSGNVRFEVDIDPRQRNQTQGAFGFRPSKLEELDSYEDDWIAKPRPFRRNGRPAGETSEEEEQEDSHFRFPVDGEPRLKRRRGKLLE